MGKQQWTRLTSDRDLYQTENDTGSFICEEDMTVAGFTPDGGNRLYRPPFGFGQPGPDSRRLLKNLRVPEGVRQIGGDSPVLEKRELFRGYIIIETLRFPGTLNALGEGVFSDCLIMDMELPASLRAIGPGAVMKCYIHTLRIPEGMPEPFSIYGLQAKKDGLACGGRQFKETIINTLIVPKSYPYSELMRETLINNVVFS